MSEDLRIVYITNINNEFENDITHAPITAISFVEKPAMESKLITFSDTKDKFSTFTDIKETANHSVLACLIRADFPILRLSETGEYFKIVFTKEVIRQIAERYTSSYFNSITNIEHNNKVYTNDNKLVEIFIKDVNKGINPIQFPDIEDGSLFVSMKVNDEELWSKIQSNEIKGLSLEGYLPIKFEKVEIINNRNMKLSFKEIANKLFKMSSEFNVEQGILYVGNLEVGAEVILVGTNGEEVYPVEGEFKVNVDDKEVTIIVTDNIITDIKQEESEQPVAEQFNEVTGKVEDKVEDKAEIEDKVEYLSTQIEAMSNEISQQREMIVALQTKIDEYGNQPIDGFSKVEDNKFKAKLPTSLERLQRFLQVK